MKLNTSQLILLPLLLIGALLVLLFRLFFSGPEDSWICVNGDWVAHGNPSVTKPVKPCGE